MILRMRTLVLVASRNRKPQFTEQGCRCMRLLQNRLVSIHSMMVFCWQATICFGRLHLLYLCKLTVHRAPGLHCRLAVQLSSAVDS